MLNKINRLAIIFIGMVFISCGYQFAGTGQLPGGIRHIYISVLENRSGESGIENIITNDLINEFIRGGYSLLKEKGRLGATLSGRIASLNINTISHKNTHSAQERRVTVLLDLQLVTSDNKVVWSATDISADQTYDVVTGNKANTEQNRRVAIENLSKRLAEVVYDRLTSNF